jgi:N-acetylglucosaminyl-diphospho-decaprenol L-rhamnosyltransferase
MKRSTSVRPTSLEAPAEPDVAAVVVTHESANVLERCLTALRDARLPVTVVDNASSDRTIELTRSAFPEATLVSLPENVGFGAAANIAIEKLDHDFVLLLNPDAWPLPGSVDRLLETAATHEQAAIVAPALETPDGRSQRSRIPYPTPWWTGSPAVSSFVSRRRRRGGSQGFAVGAALLIRTRPFRLAGGFDPCFFLFYEEVDLCLRLERAGWQIVSSPEARFVHLGGSSTRRDWPTSYRRQLEGHLRFISKHHGAAAAERARRVLIVALAARSTAGRGEQAASARAALRWLRSSGIDALLGVPPDAT